MARSTKGIRIESWTQDAIDSLSTLQISATTVATPVSNQEARTRYTQPKGTSAILDIPLDSSHISNPDHLSRAAAPLGAKQDQPDVARSPASSRIPYRRDSLKRREALLKGKEGSRRRQRWENDRLIGNPYVTPPEPHDWLPQATHPIRVVPYYLAPLWDERKPVTDSVATNRARLEASKRSNNSVPKELRTRLKRSRAAKSLLQSLEEPVRQFVEDWAKQNRAAVVAMQDSEPAAPDAGLSHHWIIGSDDGESWIHAAAEPASASPSSSSEPTYTSDSDNEIVFVGRNALRNKPWPSTTSQAKVSRRSGLEPPEPSKLIFDAPVADQGARFGRWLVHNIAAYYNLRTWSVTTSDEPARREAYVGIPEPRDRFAADLGLDLGSACGASVILGNTKDILPRPLWGLV